jgi:prolipoprotein diacylglyceryltransferase
MLARRDAFFMRTGFYQMVLWYASQRFCWEFFKPYGAIVGPLNLFQVICLGLIAYSVTMMRRSAAAPVPPETTKNPSEGTPV